MFSFRRLRIGPLAACCLIVASICCPVWAQAPAPKPPSKPAPQATPQPAPAKPAAPGQPQASPAKPPAPHYGPARLSPAQGNDFKLALSLAEQKRFADADEAAKRVGHPLARKMIEWMRLRTADSGASFEQSAAFIAANPDWPDQQGLRRRAEERITAATSPAAIRAFFANNGPLTDDGAIALVKALSAAGLGDQARQHAREAWIKLDFTAEEEQTALAALQPLLDRADHVARIDRLLWENKEADARRMVPLLSADRQAWANARLAFKGKTGDAETLDKQVPAALQKEPGLLFDRIRYLRRTTRDAEARALLLAATIGASERDDQWWVERNYHAREQIAAGEYREAYRLAAGHGFAAPGPFADAEFLAGWIALRFLKDNAAALRHFTTLYGSVQTPISKARGAYWSGRASEALGQPAQAANWYRQAAQHPETYYGQLALEKIGKAKQKLPPDPVATEAQRHAVAASEFAILARLLSQANEAARARFFMIRLMGQLHAPGEHAAALALATELLRPDFAVQMAKRAVELGNVFYALGYPTIIMPPDLPVDRALLTALARQESQFNAKAVSPVGALGLLQLMPDTARRTAGKAGLPFDRNKLLADAEYNARLGAAYFAEQLATFDNVPQFALAAYNAGPHRVTRWLAANGDPRTGPVDMVDWVELIPFNETRNYVQRVMEAYAVYRIRLADKAKPLPAGN